MERHPIRHLFGSLGDVLEHIANVGAFHAAHVNPPEAPSGFKVGEHFCRDAFPILDQ
jgi:hypothetical protein